MVLPDQPPESLSADDCALVAAALDIVNPDVSVALKPARVAAPRDPSLFDMEEAS